MTAPAPSGTPVTALPKTKKEEAVARLNEEYALVLVGDRPLVLRETRGADGRPDVRFLSLDGFHAWMKPFVLWHEGTKLQISKLWFESDKRRQYEGITFDPSDSAGDGWYNLWKGFALEPSEEGDCSLFLDHVYENVCDSDEKLYEWVIGWFAQMVQQPTVKLGTSLVLRGQQGTGKTIIGKTIGALLGGHYALVVDSRFIVGRFNSHLANCLLLQLDEATWGGDHAAAGKLKDLVTGDDQLIEFKGKEPIKVRNYLRLLITGNNSWLVPAGLEERRFCVLDVAEHKRQNHKYFQAIEDELDAGGRAKLLHYLLNFDLKDVPLRTIPQTAALLDQKLATLTPEQSWWMDILGRGSLPNDKEGLGESEASALYENYIDRVQRMGVPRRSSETSFGITLRRMVPGLVKNRRTYAGPGGLERRNVYVFPPLETCRQEFSRLTGQSEWSDTPGVADWHRDHGTRSA